MPTYTAKQILQAAASGKYLTPVNRDERRAISLITDEKTNINPDSAYKIDELICYIEANYKVRIDIIGGGSGCTKIDLVVYGTADDAVQLIRLLLLDPEFTKMARDLGFRVIYSPNGPITKNIEEQKMEAKHPVSISISNSHVENLQIESSGASINNKNRIDPGLSKLLNNIQSELKSLNLGNEERYTKAAEEFDLLKRELLSHKPRREIVTPILSNLGSIASLTSLADQIHKFLPSL